MKKLFTNNMFFAITTWFTVLGTIPFVIVVFMYYPDKMLWLANVVRVIMSACLAVTYIAYRKHSKNVMKGMMGAVLLSAVILPLIFLFVYPEYIVFSIVAVTLTVLLFINHFIINSDHHSSPSAILLNQIISLVFAALCLAEGILLIPTCVNIADTIAEIIISVVQPCAFLSIICIESRLDAYRKDREAAGWTEEKGYPEGYIHEYEKN